MELAGLSDPALVAAATASALGLTLPSQRPALEGLSAQLVQWRRAADPRQLRAPDRGLRRPGRAPAARLPGAAHPRHEPGAAARPGRGDLAGPVAGAPAPRRSLTPEELAAYESVRLFCERASDVAPSFALSEDNAGAVAEICSRLDGMPLALELAAARVGALSPAQIAERLGDSPRRADGREPVGARPPADAAGPR